MTSLTPGVRRSIQAAYHDPGRWVPLAAPGDSRLIDQLRALGLRVLRDPLTYIPEIPLLEFKLWVSLPPRKEVSS